MMVEQLQHFAEQLPLLIGKRRLLR
jgi:hypothetical protein